MRVTVGAMTVLGLSVAVAAAQPRPRERAAVLKPPQALRAGSGSIVARGVSDDFPPSTFLPSTPVARPYDAPAVGRSSAWLSGVDPNVLPAAGSSTNAGGVRTLTPAPQPKDEPSIFAKGLEKLKGIGSGRDKPAPPPQPSARPAAPPAAQPRPLEQPTAATPYRGTAANGAPVYAGPPAYRWYGWGSVTPGANPLAPAGQYPKASANWYSITGATPGAFPVPVMNPLRQPPGTEPPNYTATRPQPHPVVPAASYPVPPQPGERPAQPTYNRPAESKFMPAPHPMPAPPATTFLPAPAVGVAPPAPAFLPPPVSVPTITAPPMLKPIAVVPPLPPALVAVAEPTPITPPVAVAEPAPIVVPLPVPVPVAITPLPAVPGVAPVKPTVPVSAPTPLPTPVATGTPAPLPTTITNETRWQPTTAPTPAPSDTWVPAGEAPLPVQPANGPPAWQSGKANTGAVIVRGQMPDTKPDAIATLIRQVCQGRAEGVEIRWTGTKKLIVCFETRTAAEAQKLVTDISRRPELAPYQINFCALVK